MDRAEQILESVVAAGRGVDALAKDDRVWELQGRIAEQRGDFSLALEYIERAAEISPGDKEYAARRARLLQRLDRADEASLAYIQAHVLSRADLDLWNLSQELGTRTPTAAECAQLADLYEILDRTIQATAWRRLAGRMDTAPITESSQTEGAP